MGWLASTVEDCVGEQKRLLNSKAALEKQGQATENEIRELLQHSPALARAIASSSNNE